MALSHSGYALALILLGTAACRGGPTRGSTVFRDPAAAALADAVAKGDRTLVRTLVAAGADPNARGDSGVTLPQWAILNKSADGLDAVLTAGADPSHAENDGKTAIHYGAMANDSAYLIVLLAHHADPNTPNAVTGETPLMSALMFDRDPQFRALLVAGAGPNIADGMGNTALHVAAQINAFQRVIDLLHAGADPTARNKQGVTFQRYLLMTPASVLSEDARRQRAEIAEWLHQHGVQADTTASR